VLFGPGEWDERAVAVGELTRLRPVEIPPGVGAERHRDRRQPEAGDFVAVDVDRAYPGAVDIVDPRRWVDPIWRIFA
jgi:hypothetical protein